MKDMDTLLNFSFGLIGFVFWIIISALVGSKAKSVGLSFWLYFLITYFAKIIGLIVSIILINNRKRQLNMINMNFNNFQNQYGQGMPQGQQPYGQPTQGFQGIPQGQPYQSQPQYFGQPQGQPFENIENPRFSEPPSYDMQTAENNNFGAGPSFFNRVCKECGNTQSSGDYCNICGSKF